MHAVWLQDCLSHRNEHEKASILAHIAVISLCSSKIYVCITTLVKLSLIPPDYKCTSTHSFMLQLLVPILCTYRNEPWETRTNLEACWQTIPMHTQHERFANAHVFTSACVRGHKLALPHTRSHSRAHTHTPLHSLLCTCSHSHTHACTSSHVHSSLAHAGHSLANT